MISVALLDPGLGLARQSANSGGVPNVCHFHVVVLRHWSMGAWSKVMIMKRNLLENLVE